MNHLKRTLFISLLALSGLAVGHAHAETSAEDAANERIFQQVIKDKDGKAQMKANYLESLLGIYYRTFRLQEDFHRMILGTIEKQKTDPKYEMPIMKMPSYRKLLASWPLSERLEHRISFLYRRLIETNKDEKAEGHDRAGEMLAEINNWLTALTDQDRLLMSALMDDLKAIRKANGFAAAGSSKGRSIASVADFDFDKYNFGGKQDLSAEFAKHGKEILAKAKTYESKKDKEFEEAVAAIGTDSDERFPAAESAMKLFYKPSTDTDGTYSGVALPPGQFVQTFDDGPHDTNSDKLMDMARAYKDTANRSGIPLTFFWQVKYVQLYPDKINRAKKLKILLNNHSWNHPLDYGSLTGDDLKQQIIDADAFLVKAYGVQPVIGTSKIPFYRCPFGECIFHNHREGMPEARQMIKDLGEIHILWNIDSNDWAAINRKDPDRTAQLTIDQMRAAKRGVILMHDIQPLTPVAFGKVLDWVKNQNKNGAGIKFLSVKQAVDEANAAAKQ